MTRYSLLLPVVLAGLVPTGSLHAGEAGIRAHYLHLQEADFGSAANLGAAEMSGREQGLSVLSPSFDLGSGGLAIGADYVYTHYTYTGVPTRNRDLHRLELPLVWSMGDTLAWKLVAAPTVATSSNVFKDLFSRATSDDVHLYGAATAERSSVSGWGWRAGAGYDDRFGDPQAYPVLAVLYRQPRFAVEFGWPQARLDWQAHERLLLRMEIAPAGEQWHVVSDERDGAEFDYTVEAWRAGITAEWTFAQRWRLAAQLGSEFDRHHDFEDDTGARIDADVDSAGFAAVEVRYRFEAD
ncbi:hypothetical protein J2X06_000471 [Lysobacter niastensis]|uniref:Uncharacterized protein n=1 Tax=Lysobacter niastensis TaxID=380629 RepID=A0ABU1W6R5_9GAMM|nr:hypothetical protein [Lysobacter niastensis]MDR7133287.1 hypothetical protein [Lysobacter niastensis]